MSNVARVVTSLIFTLTEHQEDKPI